MKTKIRWTNERNDVLRRNYHLETHQLTAMFGISPKAIRCQAYKLGLKKASEAIRMSERGYELFEAESCLPSNPGGLIDYDLHAYHFGRPIDRSLDEGLEDMH